MLSSKTLRTSPSATSDRHEGLIRVIDSDYKQRVKDFWQGRAEVYDVDNTFHPPLCAHLVRVAELLRGSNVLDIATGTGYVAIAAADAVGPTGHVLGVDITESMIQQAPMMPLTETLISICMEKFGVAPEDAAVVLGNEDNIRAALTSTGFQDIQVTGTEEVKVSPDTTPGQFAENIFNMMERFPAAPLSLLLTQQQVEELRADYMVMAVPQAEALPQQDGGIVNQYVMLWAVATA